MEGTSRSFNRSMTSRIDEDEKDEDVSAVNFDNLAQELEKLGKDQDMGFDFGEDTGTEKPAPAPGAPQGPPDTSERSRSPVIVWRPSVRVRLATDLPEELFEDELEDVNSVLEHPGLLARRLPPLDPDGGRAYTSLSARPQWNCPVAKKKEEVRPRYGAWYIPAKDWGVNAWPTRRGWDESEPSEFRSKKELKSAEETQRGLNEYQEQLEAQISTLYSSRAYKDYIKATGDRIPHYLLRVDTPKEEGQPSSGRSKASKDASAIHNFLQSPYSTKSETPKTPAANLPGDLGKGNKGSKSARASGVQAKEGLRKHGILGANTPKRRGSDRDGSRSSRV